MNLLFLTACQSCLQVKMIWLWSSAIDLIARQASVDTSIRPVLFPLCRMTVTLRNTGSLPLRNLQLVISHPQVACASNSDGLSSSIAECLSAGVLLVGIRVFGFPRHSVHKP